MIPKSSESNLKKTDAVFSNDHKESGHVESESSNCCLLIEIMELF